MLDFNFDAYMQKALVKTLFVLLSAVVLIFIYQNDHVLIGFAVGTALSVINGILLSISIKRITEWKKAFKLLGSNASAEKEQIVSPWKNFMLIKFLFQVGFFLLRWTIIIGVLFLAIKFNWFNLLAMLGGLFVLPAFAITGVLKIVFYQNLRKSTSI